MKEIQQFMKEHRDVIPSRFNKNSDCCGLHKYFMLGYKYLLVRQGDDIHKSRFQPCENEDEVNYFLHCWNVDEKFNGEYAVYEMKSFDTMN